MKLKNIERTPRVLRLGLLSFTDYLLAVASVLITIFAKNETFSLSTSFLSVLYMAAVMVAGLWIFGIYKTVLRYAGQELMLRVFASGCASIGFLFINAQFLSNGNHAIFWLFLLLFWTAGITTFRRLLRIWFLHFRLKDKIEPVIIYGAGSAGRQLCAMLQVGSHLKPIAFIDDNPNLWRRKILNLSIYSIQDISKLIEQKKAKTLLFAIPTLPLEKQRFIFAELNKHPLKVLTIPSLEEITTGKKEVSDLEHIDVIDIIGRRPVKAQKKLLTKKITNKVVMVTGAGGSIGSELCRQIIKLSPKKMILIDISEIAIYQLYCELLETNESLLQRVDIEYHLGSILHQRRMQYLMQTYQVQTIYHAAAYKHVNIVEKNPIEGVQNNILGTLSMVQAADQAKVESFILISTDKAVRPTSLMGASKRVAEMILQAQNNRGSQTCFSMVRFGNVVGSSGSVIPLFQKQIKKGGPVTVTDPNVTRFFMTIPEASQLVIQASALATGGDVFLLDMGNPIKISNLAKHLVHLSGKTVKDTTTPEGDIEIKYIGLRNGEKMYEELLISNNAEDTVHPSIKKGKEPFVLPAELDQAIESIQNASKVFNVAQIEKIIQQLVPEYKKTIHPHLDQIELIDSKPVFSSN